MKASFILLFASVLLLVVSFGIQNSFAEQASGKPAWEVGSDKVCGDRLCSEIEENENSVTQESFAEELDPNEFEKCEIGHYSRAFGLGTWEITIENNENGICTMTIGHDFEGERTEFFCVLEIGKFKASNWQRGAYFPLEEETDNNCYRVKSYSVFFEGITVHMSPKKQGEIGIKPQNIVCKEGLELIFKSTDGSPACVKPSTAEKLLERGWAIIKKEYPPLSSPRTECENNGGKWLEKFQECENLTQNVCEELGGQYKSCVSACRHMPPRDPPIICSSICVRVCEFS